MLSKLELKQLNYILLTVGLLTSGGVDISPNKSIWSTPWEPEILKELVSVRVLAKAKPKHYIDV